MKLEKLRCNPPVSATARSKSAPQPSAWGRGRWHPEQSSFISYSLGAKLMPGNILTAPETNSPKEPQISGTNRRFYYFFLSWLFQKLAWNETSKHFIHCPYIPEEKIIAPESLPGMNSLLPTLVQRSSNCVPFFFSSSLESFPSNSFRAVCFFNRLVSQGENCGTYFLFEGFLNAIQPI